MSINLLPHEQPGGLDRIEEELEPTGAAGLTPEQLARWENAKRWARKVNELIGRGHMVRLTSNRVELMRMLVIPEADEPGAQIYEPISAGVIYRFFVLDPEREPNLDLTVEEFNAAYAIEAFMPAGPITW